MYNVGYSANTCCRIIKRRYKLTVKPSTISRWRKEFAPLCRFSRLRQFAAGLYEPKDMILTSVLHHQQVYRYQFHRAKCQFMVNLPDHRRFRSLQRFLEELPGSVPHDYFKDSNGSRSSQSALTFSKADMIVRSKSSDASELAAFSLQAAYNRKNRHDTVENFMLANDSVTIAAEVPVFIKREDLQHMRSNLGFEMYTSREELAGTAVSVSKLHASTPYIGKSQPLPSIITGHIDLLQIRNGQIRILDYKPCAAKERPIEQLTVYAMALSRHTGLRLYDFTCAWFDEVNYFEFYPLHVLLKPKEDRARLHINTREGDYIINQDARRIVSLQPEHIPQDKQEVWQL